MFGSSYSFVHLIFDLDGVLIDSTPCHEVAYKKLWDKLGLNGPEYVTIAGKRTIEVVSAVSEILNPTKDQVKRWVLFKQEVARGEMRDNLSIFPNTVKIIKKLHQKGWRMSVGTGASRQSALLALDQMGVSNCFDVIVTANDVTQGKPDPMVFSKVVDEVAVIPKKALVIEDSVAGVQSAIAAGCNVCTIHTDVISDSDLFVGAFKDLNSAFFQLDIK